MVSLKNYKYWLEQANRSYMSKAQKERAIKAYKKKLKDREKTIKRVD